MTGFTVVQFSTRLLYAQTQIAFEPHTMTPHSLGEPQFASNIVVAKCAAPISWLPFPTTLTMRYTTGRYPLKPHPSMIKCNGWTVSPRGTLSGNTDTVSPRIPNSSLLDLQLLQCHGVLDIQTVPLVGAQCQVQSIQCPGCERCSLSAWLKMKGKRARGYLAVTLTPTETSTTYYRNR